MLVENDSLRGYCEKNNLPYDTIHMYKLNHNLSAEQAVKAWKKMRKERDAKKEFCIKYDISIVTYRNKIKLMTEKELAEEIEETKILYDEQYISVRKYCEINDIDYRKVASKAQRQDRTIKEVALSTQKWKEATQK